MGVFGEIVYGGPSVGGDVYGPDESISIDMLGDNVLVLTLNTTVVVNDLFRDTSNYDVSIAEGTGAEVRVRKVLPPVSGLTTTQVRLEVDRPTKGVTYRVSVSGLLSKDGLDVNGGGIFIARRTKLETMLRSLARHWDDRPESLLRNFLAAISIEDDRIGGSILDRGPAPDTSGVTPVDSFENDFALLISIASPGDSFTFPAIGTTEYDIYWGDGNEDLAQTTAVAHTYTNAGTYTVRVRNWTGTDRQFSWSLAGAPALSLDAVIQVLQWGNTAWTSMRLAFGGCANFTGWPSTAGVPDLTNVTDMQQAFASCTNFNGPLNDWNVTSNITNIVGLFSVASAFNQPLDNWDVSGCNNFTQVFYFASSFNQDISSWDVSNVSTFNLCMYAAVAFNQPLNTWDVSGATVFKDMFAFTSFNQSLDNWDVSSALDMRTMFRSTPFNQDISTWDVSSVTTMASMFLNATSFDQDLSAWKLNPAGVTMTSALQSSGISQANYDAILIGWDTYVDGTDGGAKAANTPANVQLGALGLQYTLGGAAEAARTSLTSAPNNWTISGDTGV